MTALGILQILLFFGILTLITKPIGLYVARVMNGERTVLSPVLRPVEGLTYRLCGIREDEDMRWTTYTFAMLMFSLAGIVLTYILLRLQGHLPWNPQHFGTNAMTPDLAFNTSVSFATNTNWQSYVPEATLSYFSNMVSLAVHNWMSAATGIAIAIALVRGFCRPGVRTDSAAQAPSKAPGIGSFWVDVTRSTLYILLPITLVYSLSLVAQGVPQNLSPYTQVKTLEGATQTIGQGPVASQEAIKMLGTNGGGFFNANSAHPYENPTPLVNFIQMLSIFVIPAGLTYTFGKMVGNTKQGWALYAAMSVLFLAGAFICYGAEAAGNPNATHAGLLASATTGQPGGNMEGKETRFGIASSTLFATITTDASCGAVNSMHDSFTPIGGLVPLFNILTGEVIFGGVGAGLYGMLMYAILSVFIAGLMVGRTPEYLGKKIEQFEVKMAMLALLVLAASILGFSAVGANVNLPTEKTKPAAALNRVGNTDAYEGATYNNVNNSGPHGFSEILYAFASATGNNGSAFAGLTANTPIWNDMLALAMFIGRFFMIIPLLAIAGSLAKKTPVPATAGTFPTDSGTFVALLIGVIIIVGALTFLPAMTLGPIVEHLHMNGGKLW